MLKEALAAVVDRKDLEPGEARLVMDEIMSGRATPAQIAALLTALRMKGETVDELVAFVEVMLEHAAVISPRVNGILIDTCGTGGDRIKTFNISTVSAFVAAGAGALVAKHGNRAVSSRAGSADVLEALGVPLMLTPEQVCAAIEEVGIGFMFAPVFHPAMKFALQPRRELGFRTIFNLLGPLANPARVKAQVIGVYDAQLVEKVAEVLQGLGVKRALVVHGLDGLDELSTVGETQVAELQGGKIRTYRLVPDEMGITRARISELAGGDAETNARIAVQLLRGRKGPQRDAVLLNAAAALLVSGLVKDLSSGLELASWSIDSGSANRKLEELLQVTGGAVALERFT